MKKDKNPLAVGLGKLSGQKRLREGGRKVFVEMAKESWKSPKRKAKKSYPQEGC